MKLLEREGRPGIVDQESIGNLMSAQRVKRRVENKTLRTSDNQIFVQKQELR